MSKLNELFNQLDSTRLALHKNLIAYDDDLGHTWLDFKMELASLLRVIDESMSEAIKENKQ